MANYTVDTDGTSGDYSSLSACVNAIEAAGTMTENHTVTCYASTSVNDSTPVVFDGLNTGGYRLTITSGDSNYKLRCDTSTAPPLEVDLGFGDEGNITLEALNIVAYGHDGNYQNALTLGSSRSGEVRVIGCTIESESHSNREEVVYFGFDSDTYGSSIVFVNNLVISRSSSTSSVSRVFELNFTPDVYIYNNTIIGDSTGTPAIYYSGSTEDDNSVWYNNLISDCSAPYDGLSPGTADYNVTDGAWDLGGTNDLQSRTFTFVGGGDYHLDSSDTGAMDNGTDLSSDSNYSFSDDIDGDTRSDWDCGADEYSSGTSTTELTVSALSHARGVDSFVIGQFFNLLIEALTHSQGADTVTASQLHNLLASALAHDHSLDSLAPGQLHNLLVGALDHGRSIDDVGLSAFYNLLIEDIASAQALDGVSIGQHHILFLESALLSHQLDGISTSEAGTIALVMAALEHAHSLDSLTVSQLHALVINELIHSQEIDTIDLGAIGVIALAMEALSHAQALDGLGITQGHALELAGLVSGQSIDSFELGQLHALAAAGLLSGHSLDEISLASLAALSIQALSHAQALDGVTVTQFHAVVVDSLGHSQTIDGLSLSQLHELIIESLASDTNIDTISILGSVGQAVGDVSLFLDIKKSSVQLSVKNCESRLEIV